MIKNKKFRHKKTGEIVEIIDILKINEYEEISENERTQEI